MNSSRQGQRTSLRRLDNSIMTVKTDPEEVLAGICFLRDELSVMNQVILEKRTTTIILDALPSIYGNTKSHADRDQD